MYVLLDIEWFQESQEISYITQVAASRVSEDWSSTADLSCLVCPPAQWSCDWEHMAFNGYSPDEFGNGCTEAEFVDRLDHFLQEDDVICVWSKDSKRLLREKYEFYAGKPLLNRCVCVNDKVYSRAKRRKIHVFEMYAVAEALGMETPVPKHCSINDISVLSMLLSTLNYKQTGNDEKATSQPAKKVVSKAERNADILARVQYNYVFAPDSKVFHRPSCKLMLRANDIMGCTYYNVAEKNRRPCKICHPELGEKVLAVKGATEKQPPAESGNTQERKSGKVIVSAKLLGNQRIMITKNKIVGCCHNVIHPGKLTAKIMEQHDCLGKQCRYFEKYEDSGYWIAQEQKRKEKEKKKAVQQKQKEEAQRLEDELEEMKELFQSYIDAFDYELLIVRLQKESANHYKVFYVSEYGFADGNRFPSFLETVKYYFPRCRIELRHIRDVDGHFVTLDEYLSRKGLR